MIFSSLWYFCNPIDILLLVSSLKVPLFLLLKDAAQDLQQNLY